MLIRFTLSLKISHVAKKGKTIADCIIPHATLNGPFLIAIENIKNPAELKSAEGTINNDKLNNSFHETLLNGATNLYSGHIISIKQGQAKDITV